MIILKWPGRRFHEAIDISCKEKCPNCGTKIKIDSMKDLIANGVGSYDERASLLEYDYECPYCNKLNHLSYKNNIEIEKYLKANNLYEVAYDLNSEVDFCMPYLDDIWKLGGDHAYKLYKIICLSKKISVNVPSHIQEYIDEKLGYIKNAMEIGELPEEFDRNAYEEFQIVYEHRIGNKVFKGVSEKVGAQRRSEPEGMGERVREISRFQDKDGHDVYSFLASDGYCYNYICNSDGRVINRYVGTEVEYCKWYANDERKRKERSFRWT